MSKQRVLYKVVNKKNKSLIIDGRSRYCLTYEKGKIVNSLDGTLGIFCFERRLNAEAYANNWKGKVLRVIPMGKVKRPKEICPYRDSESISKFYKMKNNYFYTRIRPAHTVVCNKIKVLP